MSHCFPKIAYYYCFVMSRIESDKFISFTLVVYFVLKVYNLITSSNWLGLEDVIGLTGSLYRWFGKRPHKTPTSL